MCVHIKKKNKTNPYCKKRTRKQKANSFVFLVYNKKILSKGQIALSKKINVSYKINLI